ncbi:MAG: hypothetical protein [Circular genetic element sp.]|nr:MAG: hypothetical protein [Circular genetic element sp.]
MKGLGMTQRYLKYRVSTDTNANTDFINLARDLSALNRQLFRQCRTYRVKSIRVVDGVPDGSVEFGCAPNTWAMKNSLKRAYRRWNEMNAQVLKEQPSLKSKWHDFKPYLSLTHKGASDRTGSANILIPEDIGGEQLKYGDWQYSEFESPDATSSVDGYHVGILGQQSGAAGSIEYVGLIESYGNTRSTVNETPQVNTAIASDDPLLNLLDAGTQFDEVAENIIDENDLPPYALEAGSGFGQEYVGGQNNMRFPQQFGEVSANENRNNSTIYNVDVPLGIIRLDHNTFTGTTSFTILVELAPGGYKGVHSEALV